MQYIQNRVSQLSVCDVDAKTKGVNTKKYAFLFTMHYNPLVIFIHFMGDYFLTFYASDFTF
jgi:hypothetical protein